jgi:hypothetical protein
MESISATEVVPEQLRRPFKRHSCLAIGHFDAPVGAVREAIAGAAQGLKGFSPALESWDDNADLEVAFHTPAQWLDVLSFYLRPMRPAGHGAGEGGESTAVVVFSRSTNLMPDRAPWSWCRCCCGGMRLFTDSGQNRKHVTTFFDDLESRLKQSSFLEIVYAS